MAKGVNPDQKIGERLLTQDEELNRTICNLTLEDVKDWTPRELAEHADFISQHDDNHLGS